MRTGPVVAALLLLLSAVPAMPRRWVRAAIEELRQAEHLISQEAMCQSRLVKLALAWRDKYGHLFEFIHIYSHTANTDGLSVHVGNACADNAAVAGAKKAGSTVNVIPVRGPRPQGGLCPPRTPPGLRPARLRPLPTISNCKRPSALGMQSNELKSAHEHATSSYLLFL